MEEMAVILKRFGDEQSTLLDQFERLSFEVQLNQAILGRSRSEPGLSRSRSRVTSLAPPPIVTQVQQGRRHHWSGFQKVLKKLLKPILGRKNGREERKQVPDPKDPRFWKSFSRSIRF
ncbi:Leukocyte immunoglobulin-like receptor subfamily A member [Quillaja saponaria]|uniref:Leukocyte immunoglobulin-like receptor subfamily A member n=1 Tax=Quillaja saponaria TaxID=32244 RepID=A0AAD7PMC3_QUISA|nr:Leukocyte immunoglobulin-like receptor subfamily A member [Quillaja saponaria]